MAFLLYSIHQVKMMSITVSRFNLPTFLADNKNVDVYYSITLAQLLFKYDFCISLIIAKKHGDIFC